MLLELFKNGFSVCEYPRATEKLVIKSQITSIRLSFFHTRVGIDGDEPCILGPETYPTLLKLFTPESKDDIMILRLSDKCIKYWSEGIEIKAPYGLEQVCLFITRDSLKTVRFSLRNLSAKFVYNDDILRIYFPNESELSKTSNFLKKYLLNSNI
jgi:hypothetical protein